MNYDPILAVYNCFKEKIKPINSENNIKKEIPEEIKNWYEEWKTIYIEEDTTKETILKNISEVKEDDNNNLYIYYISPREADSRVVTDSLEKDKIIEELVEETRDKMNKETIYRYLSTVLTNIEIPPFKAEKQEAESIYECEATSQTKEKIKIDYDEETLKTNISIKNDNKTLKISLFNNIISTRYDGMITIVDDTKKKNIFSKLFKFCRKSKFELKNQTKADFISVTKDVISSICLSSGTIYSKEGIYIFNGINDTFNINYFDKATINTIHKKENTPDFELSKYIKKIDKHQDLANTTFIEDLEKYGLLPNNNITIPCTSKELQILTNKAFLNPKNFLEEHL